MHPRNFGSEEIVRTGCVSPYVHPLEIKTTTTKADSFFRLNFNVYIDVDNKQRGRAKDKNQRRPISLEEKHNTFIAAVRKRRNPSCHQAENERQRIESEQDHIQHFLHKTCN